MRARLCGDRCNQLTVQPQFAYLRELKQLSVFPLGVAILGFAARKSARISLFTLLFRYHIDIMKHAKPIRKSVIAIKRTMPMSEMLGKWRNVLLNSERVTCSRLPEMNAKQRGSSY